jgi:hypothetical protein
VDADFADTREHHKLVALGLDVIGVPSSKHSSCSSTGCSAFLHKHRKNADGKRLETLHE